MLLQELTFTERVITILTEISVVLDGECPSTKLVSCILLKNNHCKNEKEASRGACLACLCGCI